VDGGSSKSWGVADKLLFELVQNPNLSVICLREIQRSIKHSSKKLIEERIEFYKLHAYFTILDTEIRSKLGSGIIIFNGLQTHTVDSIKSLEGFDIAWVEEAQTISEYSIELLIPTIRKNGSKLYFTWNPKHAEDPIENLEHDQVNKTTIHINYLDNPFCPESITAEAEEMKRRRLKKYNHIYLGMHGVSEGLIFENVEVRVIREDEVKGMECLQGGDFGFTNDNSTFSINYVDHKNKKLYVFDGFSKKGMHNSEIADRVKSLKAHKHITRWDCAEPKSIAHLNVLGARSMPSEKGKDSVIAGISYMQEFDIIVNAHLSDFVTSFNNYAWDVDKITGKPINKPNHDFSDEVDGVRYSLSHLYNRRNRNKRGNVRPRGI